MSKSLHHRPFARPGERAAYHTPVRETPALVDEIPSINEFLDELPPIEDFLMLEAVAEAFDASQTPAEPAWEPVEAEPIAVGADGWVSGSWQTFDWGSAASLNRQTPQNAPALDWDESLRGLSGAVRHGSMASVGASPTADEVANALDGIARRIRSGELVIDNLKGTPPEAAMAAALAVILRMRG